MNKRILLTGGAGFIGSSIYDSIKKKNQVFIIDNFVPFYDLKMKLANLNIGKSILKSKIIDNVFNCDIRDYHDLKKICEEVNPHVIIHCAAMPGVLPSFEHSRDYHTTNVEGTLNILECAKKLNIKKILFLSSSSVYGDNPRRPFKEEFTMMPISFYGLTKKEGEDLCRFYSSSFGIDITVLRLFTVYGPRQRPDLMLHKFFLNHISGRVSEVYGLNKTSRDYTYIDDAVSGITKALNYLTENEGFNLFNIGSMNPVPMKRVINGIMKIFPTFKFIEKPVISGDMKDTHADISKAEKILGYKPKFSFEQGSENFNKWFKDYYNL